MKGFYSLVVVFVAVFLSCKPDPDSIIDNSVILDAPVYFLKPNIPSDNPLTKSGISLGKMLFYEKALSIDSTRSCASCHIQKFGFSDTARFSSGVKGRFTTRKSMGLSNLAWQTKFFWDGRANSIENQVFFPLENPNEMNLSRLDAVNRLRQNETYRTMFEDAFGTRNITPNLLAKAIAQFERIIVSGESKYDLYKQGKTDFTTQEKRGEQLFFTHPDPAISLRGGNCGDCHAGALTSNNKFANNGLDSNPSDIGLEETSLNENDKGKFKIVSLRNVELHPPYMHDGRFGTLEEVLDHYNGHIQFSATLDPQITAATNQFNATSLQLTAQEKEDIIVFLKTLTDKKLIKNKKFHSPFE